MPQWYTVESPDSSTDAFPTGFSRNIGNAWALFLCYWPPPGDDDHLFCTGFLKNQFRWHLWTDFYETLRHDVYRSASEHYGEIFRYRPPPSKKLGSKTTYFRRLRNSVATLRTNISGEEHDIDNMERALETTKGPYTLSENFINFDPLTAKIGTEFSHTLRNHHLGGGGHNVGPPFGVPTFLVNFTS